MLKQFVDKKSDTYLPLYY